MSAEHSSPRATPLWRALALALALPALAHLVGSRGEGAGLVLVAFALPRVLCGRDPLRVYCAGVGLGLVVPLWPVVAGIAGFALERVALHGALAAIAWSGALAGRVERGGWVRAARAVLVAWAAWSLGSCAVGLWVNFPAGAPWVADSLRAGVLEHLRQRSLVEPTQPLVALALRLEMLALVWVGLELELRSRRLLGALGRALVLALPAGFATAVVEMWRGSHWRGESFVARITDNVGRMHRPLADHNALGSALVLVVPVLAWLALERVLRGVRGGAAERRARALAAGLARSWLELLALAMAVTLLVFTRSKAALGATALAIPIAGAAWVWSASARARRLATAGALLALALLFVVNVLPAGALRTIASNRHGEDFLRLTHRKGLASYLRGNRFSVWRGGALMLADHAAFGVGLGNFPRRLADYRDPAARSLFNPYHENAHDQWLQWGAEEGLVGLALGLLLIGLALAGGLRAARAPPPASGASRVTWLAWTAALAALCVNLLAGHSLLVPSVAYLFAAWLAALLGALERDSARTARADRGVLGAVALAVLALACAPIAWAPRALLAGFASGCFPWSEPERRDEPRARGLAPDARWIQRWGAGPRMLIAVKDVRPGGLFPGVQRVSLELDGVRVLDQRELPRAADATEENPVGYLKVDAPSGVGEGDLVRVRLVSEIAFSGSLMFAKDQAIIGVRMLEPVFLDQRR